MRSEAVLLRRTPDGLLLLTERSDAPVVLRGTGALTWELLSRPSTLEELAEVLEAAHDVDREQVVADLRPFLETLREAGALELTS